jgi:hypothetical protein
MSNSVNRPQAVRERRIDIGAQVGIARNLAFAMGGRTHRLTDIAYYTPRPVYDAPLHLILPAGQPAAIQASA